MNEYRVARAWRDARVTKIWAGTNEVMKELIGRDLGPVARLPAARSTDVREFDGVASFEGMLGEHLGYSGWLPVPQELIDRFADVTGDHQWIHVNRAARGPFGGTIAHGYLALSLLPQLLWHIYRLNSVSMEKAYQSETPPRER
jgi:MaoC like domain/Acyl-CoA dehydrogenase, C-terminal domain